jgi:hypothetical protein
MGNCLQRWSGVARDHLQRHLGVAAQPATTPFLFSIFFLFSFKKIIIKPFGVARGHPQRHLRVVCGHLQVGLSIFYTTYKPDTKLKG